MRGRIFAPRVGNGQYARRRVRLRPGTAAAYTRGVHRLLPLRRVLDASSDPDNPSAEELDEFLHRARRIAVIGLSRDPEKAARRVPSYLAAKGYEIIPVNPHAERILGRDSYPDVTIVPGKLDAVIVFRPSEVAGDFVKDIMARPDRPAIWLQEGIRADEEIAEARAQGTLAVQDLCAYKVHRALQM